MGVDLLAKGRALNLNNEEMISWDINHIVLIGSSYGGGIAVSALGSSDHSVSAAIAFCPLLEPSKQNIDINLPEDNLATLYPYLRRCHENVYRNLNDHEWRQFLEGNHPADPTKFLAKIGQRPLLLMHGADDSVVRSFHTKNFYENLKDNGAANTELIIKENVGHGRALRMFAQHIWTDWLLNLFK